MCVYVCVGGDEVEQKKTGEEENVPAQMGAPNAREPTVFIADSAEPEEVLARSAVPKSEHFPVPEEFVSRGCKRNNGDEKVEGKGPYCCECRQRLILYSIYS